MKRLVAPTLMALVLAACKEDGVPAAGQADAVLTPVQRGLAVANANACTACHTLNGARGIGPSWVGIYGSTQKLADGSTALVDDAYLEPAAQIVEGFDNVMVPAPVTEAQVMDIIALIKELQDGPL
jgi:cytochrome c oxidase subunit 2